MNIEGRIIIERYSNGKLLERRETKNVLRGAGADMLSWYGWFGTSAVSGTIGFLRSNNIYPITRLVLAKEDKTTIKYIDNPSLTRVNDTVNIRWVVRLAWSDTSADAYTVYYIGLMWMYETPTVGANNITGSPPSRFAAKIDPPMSKASGDTLSISWEISIPYGEVP